MNVIPRDAAPTFTGMPRAPLPKDATPVAFTRKPVPPILPDKPPPIPPDPPAGITDATLQPLTWHTGLVDEHDIYWGTDRLWAAVVDGAWPPNTTFDWVIYNGSFAFQQTKNAVAFFVNATGTIAASVTVSAPNCDPQTLGPITLTVTNSGCC